MNIAVYAVGGKGVGLDGNAKLAPLAVAVHVLRSVKIVAVLDDDGFGFVA